MSGEVSDTYAVVKKTKKCNTNDDASCSPQLHQDSITDVNSVVDKTRKINEETSNRGKYDVITADAIKSTTADLYDYASAPVYGKLYSTQSKTMETNKLCGPNKNFQYFFGNVKCQKHHSVITVSFLIVLNGFQSDNDRILRNNQSVNQNHVDGVSFTHGTNPDRTHIWTYIAAIKFGNAISRCTICDKDKPFYIGTNFTCTTGHCTAWPCLNNAIWTDRLPCAGNEAFHRRLSESTTDNIEMRVCRDQGRHDKDILISYVEIFVL